MRLIDADLLIEKLKDSIVTPNYHPDLGDAFQCMEVEEHNEEIICMIETVQGQPTAYDVDKVIERLENEKYVIGVNATIDGITTKDYIEGYNDGTIGAIEIVKGGGQGE